VRLPAEYVSIRYWDQPAERRKAEVAPVLLVHGYGGTDRMWKPLRDELDRAGFDCVIALRYNASRSGIGEIAEWLVSRATQAMRATGIDRVHLVGHSLGGLVVREAVQRGGLAGRTSSAVTIATPHAGARLAHFVPGPAARQMRPGSAFLAELAGEEMDRRTRWVAIAGESDRVVRNSSAGSIASAEAVTLRQRNAGHGSIARHPDVLTFITNELLRAEAPVHQAFSLAA
jgi:pimeloyl-ACP methyl ester carboxylesterase